MSKLIPLLFAGAGTATVSVGGFYLIKGSGAEDALVQDASDSQGSVASPEEVVDKLSEFKNGDACVTDVFTSVGNLSNLEGASPLDQNSLNNDTSFFGAQVQDATKNKSCLLVGVDKKEYTVGDGKK